MKVKIFFLLAPLIASTSLAQINTSREAESPPEAYLILARSLADPHLTGRDSAKMGSKLPQTIIVYRKILRDLFAVAATGEHRDCQ